MAVHNITGTLTPVQDISGRIGSPSRVSGDARRATKEYITIPEYSGAYTVTPTQQTQTLATKNKKMIHNIVVEPIPQNYGLISWNGSVLTVS